MLYVHVLFCRLSGGRTNGAILFLHHTDYGPVKSGLERSINTSAVCSLMETVYCSRVVCGARYLLKMSPEVTVDTHYTT